MNQTNLTNMLFPVIFLIIWSFGAVFTKLGLHYSSIWSFLFLRSSIALTLLFLIIIFYKEKKDLFPKKDQIFKIILTGLLLQFLYLVFYFYTIKTDISLGLVILVLGTQPLLTIFFNIKSLTLSKFLLVIISLAGLFITVTSYKSSNNFNLLGFIFSFIALLSITIGTYLQSKIHSNILANLLLQTFIAWLCFFLIVLYDGLYVTWNVSFIASLLWMGSVVSVIAFLLLNYMLSKNTAENVSMLFLLLPISTFILDAIIFKTPFSFTSIIGALIVMISVFIFQKKFRNN
ncbi:DMT family transporter [Acinetobacter baumannii]|nr:DMT family transporter [Acinetobacter baumannii]MDC5546724.1 DMT family transporter [Acinetobacter baumannii]